MTHYVGSPEIPPAARPLMPGGAADGEPTHGREDGIWWRASGLGRPLLLIQGVGYPAAMWHRLVPLLEPYTRVIVFDHRGIGNSYPASGLEGLTIRAMASDAASVIQAVADGPVDVLGVSLGGIVAQELALAYPQLVDRLVLAATHTADARLVVADNEVIQMMNERPSLPDEEALRSSVPYVYAPSTPEAVIEEDLVIRRAMHRSWEAYKAQMGAIMRYDGTSTRLPHIDSPTLVLHGELDRLVPPGNAEVIHSRIPRTELHIMPGVSHNLFSDAPEAMADIVVEFLRKSPHSVSQHEVAVEPSLLDGLTGADEAATSGDSQYQPVGDRPFPTTTSAIVGPDQRAAPPETDA